MKNFLMTTQSIHIIAFIMSVAIVVFFFGWQSRIFLLTTISYPLVFILAYILAKKIHPYFMMLPMINFVIIVGFMTYFAIFLVINQIEFRKNNEIEKEETRIENLKKIEQASRDFICDDGSFFSLSKSVMINENAVHDIKYYGTFALENPDIRDASAIGFIDKSKKAVIDLWDVGDENHDVIMKKLSTCKNKEGKSLLEVYLLDTKIK